MQYDVLSTGSRRRGRVCSVCKKVVKIGEKGAFNSNSAWHLRCLAEFLDSTTRRSVGSKDRYLLEFVNETSEERRAKAKAEVDKQFEEFRQRLLKEGRSG